MVNDRFDIFTNENDINTANAQLIHQNEEIRYVPISTKMDKKESSLECVNNIKFILNRGYTEVITAVLLTVSRVNLNEVDS